MLRLTLKFVRHGETDENRKKIIQGQLDFKLNALGKQQALVVAKALEHVPFTHAFSSDLSRAQETAETIVQFHDIPLVIQSKLREKSCGDAEGTVWGTKIKIKNHGETHAQLQERAAGWWEENIPPLLHESRANDKSLTVLIVGHGAFLRTLIELITSDARFRIEPLPNQRARWILPNTGISTVEIFDEGNEVYGKLVSYGDDKHIHDGHAGETPTKENVDDLAAE